MSYNENGEKVLLSKEVRIAIQKSKDSSIRLEILKKANGSSYDAAIEKADLINYNYRVEENTILLDNFLSLLGNNRFNDLEVKTTLYIPENTIIKYGKLDRRCWTIRTNNDQNMDGCEMTEYSWEIAPDGELQCLDCPEKKTPNKKEENKITINEQGIHINVREDGENNNISINEEGINIDIKDKGESFKMKIDQDGVNINSKEGN